MCGIFGTYHAISMDETQRSILRQMMQVGIVRGYDGTGLMAGVKDNLKTIKVGTTPEALPYHDKWNEFVPHLKESNFVVGHHRSATRGDVNDENAHPFTYEHITLVHNGTISSGLNVKHGEVDSNILCREIATVGIKEAIKRISGPYVIFWWDDKLKRLNLIKNELRPLELVLARGNYYWASERRMLDWLLFRNINNLQENQITRFSLPKDVVHFFDGKDLRVEGARIEKQWEAKNTQNFPPPVPRLPPPSTQKLPSGDFYADFLILSEEVKTSPKGTTSWKYYAQSFENEYLFFYSDVPFLGYQGKEYHGSLLPGPRINWNGYIDKTLGHECIFYEVNVESIVEIDSTPPPKYLTKDNYPLSKSKMKRLTKQKCVKCASVIHEHEINKCMTLTDQMDNPKGLFCPACVVGIEKNIQKDAPTHVVH